MEFADLTDDALIRIAEVASSESLGQLAKVNRRLKALLWEDVSMRAHLYLGKRGVGLAVEELRWRMVSGSERRGLDFVLAVLRKPKVHNTIPDNYLYDIVLAAVAGLLTDPHDGRGQLLEWAALLPSKRPVMSTESLIVCIRFGMIGRIRDLVCVGGRLKVPTLMPAPLTVEPGSMLDDWAFVLSNVAPDDPRSISIDPILVEYDHLRLFLERYRQAWATQPACAAILRRAYGDLEDVEPMSPKAALLRHFDPLESLEVGELEALLVETVKASTDEDDPHETEFQTFAAIIDNNRVDLGNMIHLLEVLTPSTEHRMMSSILDELVLNPVLYLDDWAYKIIKDLCGKAIDRSWDAEQIDGNPIYLNRYTRYVNNSFSLSRAYKRLAGMMEPVY